MTAIVVAVGADSWRPELDGTRRRFREAAVVQAVAGERGELLRVAAVLSTW